MRVELIILIGLTVVLLGCFFYIIAHLKRAARGEHIEGAIKELLEKTGAIEEMGRDIKNIYSNINMILGSKSERGKLGEFSLETILKDALPNDKFRIQYSIPGVGIVDAAILTSEGTIPIDSKFPMENYRNMVTAEKDSERTSYRSVFKRDMRRHILDVKNYIHPKANTTSYALLYIPSEAVYYYLITEEFETVHLASQEHVYIVSPTTLSSMVNVIKVGFRGEQISKEAKRILASLNRLDVLFQQLKENLSTLGRHIRDSGNSFERTNASYDNLKTEYDHTKET